MNYIIGIDAGATKTDLWVADESGRVVGRARGGRGNLRYVSEAQNTKNLQQLWQRAKKKIKNKSQIKSVCAGFSGLDATGARGSDLQKAQKIIQTVFPQAQKQIVVNDVIIARASNSDLPYGLALISGTGSHGYGINQKGREAFVSGIGWLLTDEGSAFSVGRQALRAAARDQDGREASILGQMVKQRLKIKSMRQASAKIYNHFDKTFIASFAPLVDRAAARGDRVAKRILNQAADELFLMAQTLTRQLNLNNTRCDLVLIGSQVNKSQVIQKRLTGQIRKNFPKLRLVYEKKPAVVGALKIAQQQE